MKNELFKDPFVVMLIAVSAAGNSEKLHRLIFDENFLREHLSTHLEKDNPRSLYPFEMRIQSTIYRFHSADRHLSIWWRCTLRPKVQPVLVSQTDQLCLLQGINFRLMPTLNCNLFNSPYLRPLYK